MPRLYTRHLLKALLLGAPFMVGCHGSETCAICKPGQPTSGVGWIAPTRFETVPVDRPIAKADAPQPVNPMTIIPDPPDVKKLTSKNVSDAPATVKTAKTTAPAVPPVSGPVIPPSPPATPPAPLAPAVQSSATKAAAVPGQSMVAMQVKGPLGENPASGSMVSVTWLQKPPSAPQASAVAVSAPKAALPEPPGSVLTAMNKAPASKPAQTLPLATTTTPIKVPQPDAPVVPVAHTTPALTTPVAVPEPVCAEKQQPPESEPRKLVSEFAFNGPYGHADDYSWISGQAEKWRNQWRLRYAPVDQADPHGGCVTLVGDAFFSQLRDGEHFKLHGRLVPANNRGGATFQIQSVASR